MPYSIKEHEIKYLRELARKQLEYSKLPVMREREKRWQNINNGVRDIAPVVIETWTFDHDMMPDSIYRCESPDAKHLEYSLLKNIREHELIDDDKVIPDFFSVGYKISIDEFGVPLDSVHDEHSGGYKFINPIKDLKNDLPRLKLPVITHDIAASVEYRDFIADIIGDILPVEFESRPPTASLTQKAIRLMGMESFFIAMYEEPDEVHMLMDHIAKCQLATMKYYENNDLLTVNNRNHQTGPSSYGFTDRIPSSTYDPDHVSLKDICLWVESQETVGISPDMFREFCIPYYERAARPLGLVYYGCCEPVHSVWKDIYKAIPQIFKVSVSPWCDQQFMGEALAGTNVVFSRKPSPNFLGVADTLDEEAWASHIRETALAARSCQSEIIIRDVYKVGHLSRAKRAVEIAREVVSNV